MSVIDAVKAHPLIAGGVAVLAIIIIVVLSSSGKAPQVQTAAAPGATADATALQVAQMQATTDANSISAQLQALQITTSASLAGKTLEAQTTDNANYLAYKAHSEDTAAALNASTLTSSLSAQIAAQQSKDAATVALAGYTNQQTLAQIQADQNVHTAQILEQAVASSNDTTRHLADVQSQTSIAEANINSITTQHLADVSYNTNVATAGIAANVAVQQSAYSLEATRISSAASVQAAKIAADAASANSFNALQASMSHDEHSGGLFGGGGFLGLGW